MNEPPEPGYYWARWSDGHVTILTLGTAYGNPCWSDSEGLFGQWDGLVKAGLVAIEPVLPPSWSIQPCHCGGGNPDPPHLIEGEGWRIACPNAACPTWVEQAGSRAECVAAWNGVQAKSRKP